MFRWLFNKVLTDERMSIVIALTMVVMFVVMMSSYVEMCHYRTLWESKTSHIASAVVPTPKPTMTTSSKFNASLLDSFGNVTISKKRHDVQIVELRVSTLAIKNKNPLNVKCLEGGKKWKGQIGRDKIGHAVFRTWEDGIRAAAFVLKNYESKHGINTIEDIVTRFAKAKGKVKEEYITFLCKRMRLEPNEEFSIKKRMPELLKHMTRFESGQDFPDRFFRPYDVVSSI